MSYADFMQARIIVHDGSQTFLFSVFIDCIQNFLIIKTAIIDLREIEKPYKKVTELNKAVTESQYF